MIDTTTIAELDALIAACKEESTYTDQDMRINALLDRFHTDITTTSDHYTYRATIHALRALRMRMCSATPSWRPAVGEAVWVRAKVCKDQAADHAGDVSVLVHVNGVRSWVAIADIRPEGALATAPQTIAQLRQMEAPQADNDLALVVALLSDAQVQDAILTDNAPEIRFFVGCALGSEASAHDRMQALADYDRVTGVGSHNDAVRAATYQRIAALRAEIDALSAGLADDMLPSQ